REYRRCHRRPQPRGGLRSGGNSTGGEPRCRGGAVFPESEGKGNLDPAGKEVSGDGRTGRENVRAASPRIRGTPTRARCVRDAHEKGRAARMHCFDYGGETLLSWCPECRTFAALQDPRFSPVNP